MVRCPACRPAIVTRKRNPVASPVRVGRVTVRDSPCPTIPPRRTVARAALRSLHHVARRARLPLLVALAAGLTFAPHSVPGQSAARTPPTPAVGTLEYRFATGSNALAPSAVVRLLFRADSVRQEVRLGTGDPLMIGLFAMREGSGVLLMPPQRAFVRVPAHPSPRGPSRDASADASGVLRDTTPALIRASGRDSVAGFGCTVWRTPPDAATPVELCLAPAAAVGASLDMVAWIANVAAQLLGLAPSAALPPDLRSAVPLRIRVRDGAAAFELVRFDPAPVDAALFRMPTGYTEQVMPGAGAAPLPPQ